MKPGARNAGWNRFARNHGAPSAIGAVVPVAVRAAVEQQDLGSTRAERGQRVEERLGEELGRARVVAVKENEHPVAVAPRHDDDLTQVSMHEVAVHGEMHEPSAPRRVVLRTVATTRDRQDDHG